MNGAGGSQPEGTTRDGTEMFQNGLYIPSTRTTSVTFR
jgi:hypothetical protein